jgi:proline iminopeptidase
VVRTIVVDGVRQVYEIAGEGPACLAHSGGPGVHPGYLRMPGLERHLTMVYLHPVGSGSSGLLPDRDYSMSRYGDFAEAVLDSLGASTGYFLGHSHGGFVGLQFGLERATRLSGLILYSTRAVFHGPDVTERVDAAMKAFVDRWPDRPEAVEAGRIWDEVYRGDDETDDDSETATRHLELLLPAYFADYRKTVEQLGAAPSVQVTEDPNRRRADFDVRDRLGEINVPALVISGSYDFICGPEFSRELHAGLPDSRLHEFPYSGHLVHLEETDAFNAAALSFVRPAV